MRKLEFRAYGEYYCKYGRIRLGSQQRTSSMLRVYIFKAKKLFNIKFTMTVSRVKKRDIIMNQRHTVKFRRISFRTQMWVHDFTFSYTTNSTTQYINIK